MSGCNSSGGWNSLEARFGFIGGQTFLELNWEKTTSYIFFTNHKTSEFKQNEPTWCWLVSKCVRQHEIYRPHCYRMGKKPKTFVLFAKTVQGLKRNDCNYDIFVYDVIFLRTWDQTEGIHSAPFNCSTWRSAWLCLACQGTVHSQHRFLKEHRPSCSARLALSSTNSPAAIWLSLNPLFWRKLPLDMTWPDLTTLFSTLFALAPCLAVSVVRKVLTRRCKGLANAEISRGYQE